MATAGEAFTRDAGAERFDIGRVASRTFGVIGRNPLLFFGIALLFSGLPTLAIAYYTPNTATAIPDASWIAPFAGAGFAYVILSSLLQTGLVVATLQDLSGQRVDFAACVRRALVMFFPLIGMSIVVGFGLVFGFLLLVVPGVILYLMWFVAVPALVEERRGVFAALGRSSRLTSGARWPIFGLVVAFAVVSMLISGIATFVAGLAGGIALSAVISALASMVTSLIASTGVAAAYVELRTVKEGANIDTLAAVFA